MIKGVLENGFEFEYDESRVNDMKFVDILSEVEDNPLLFSKAATMMLGKEQKERLYKFLEDENGRVSVELFGAAITEIIEKSSTLKN